MAESQAFWADVLRDVASAKTSAAEAAYRDQALREKGAELEASLRRDREYAVGFLLHSCYGALESALERLVHAIDDGLPSGRWYHRDLVNRAAAPIPDLRPALISKETAALLHRLRSFRHIFRHIYEEYDYAKAGENVPIALDLIERFGRDIAEAGRALGLAAD